MSLGSSSNGSRERRGFAAIALLFSCAACGSGSQKGLPDSLSPGAAAGFNLLVLTLDTTRADHLGCYGYGGAKTPSLDGLAAEGVRFADAVTVAPLTLPSHASIFTGLTPPSHGARDNSEYRLAEKHSTLAEGLAGAGYDTAAFLSAFVLDARFGLNQGFDVYNDRLSTAGAYGDFAERSGKEVTAAAIQWLERRKGDAPFFCWVHYFDPHFPYVTAPGSPAQTAGAAYDGEIEAMDREIGRLLGTLEALGQRERTVILAVADHGESLGEHDEETHGMLIYDSVMRVPLILSCRGLVQGAFVVDDAVVSTVDIVPTLFSLLGIEDREPRDGLDLLAGPPPTERVAYMEAMAPYLQNGWSPLHGLRRHGDKYIQAPRREYFDLGQDPDEWNNLYGMAAASPGVEELEADMERRLADAPDLEGVEESRQELDLSELAVLESLGYTAGVAPEERTGLEDPKDMVSVLKSVGEAETLISQGKLREALLVTERTVARSPRHRRVLLNQATLLSMLGRNDEALEALDTFESIRPSSDGYLLRGQILIGLRRIPEGEAALKKAEELEPRHGGIWIARGDILAMQGKTSAALEAYQRAGDIDPYRVMDAARERIAQLRKKSAPR